MHYYIYIICLFNFLLFAISNNTFAWNKTGHQLTSEIAYNYLDTKEKQKLDLILDNLIKYLDESDKKIYKNQDYNLSKIAKLSILPDYWRSYYFSSLLNKYNCADHKITNKIENIRTKYWHYYNQNNKKQENKNKYTNGIIVEILEQLFNNIKSSDKYNITINNKNYKSKALAIIFISHLTADIHQPLHTFSKYTNNIPDNGGNNFCLNKKCSNNLHSYWDSSANYLSNYNLKNKKLDINKKFSKNAKITNLNNKFAPALWGSENIKYYDFIYSTKEYAIPDKSYKNKTIEIAQERIYTAGIRLGSILKEILK